MFWNAFKSELAKLTGGKQLFLICAMICSFCIMGDYGVVRPVSHSIFLSTYGSSFFTYVWLAVVPLNFLVVELYNRYLARIGIYKMFYIILTSVLLFNVCSFFYMHALPFLPFVFYMWKEIYVMLLFQQVWSVIHSTIKLDQAKYLYGLIFASGGLGGILGNSFSSYFAIKMGSTNLLAGSLPLLILLGISFYFLAQHSSLEESKPQTPTISNFWQGVQAIKASRYLSFILAIVVVMQVTVTLIYQQFNTMLEQTIPFQDARTAYCGKIFGLTNVFSLSFQLFGTFLLVHFLGLKRSHLAMPLLLTANAIGSLIFPTFSMISIAFATIKAFDFSLFSVVKEMLYVPLKQEEKFQAKSIIDVFAYRSSKAVASLLILLLNGIGFSQLLVPSLSWVVFGLLMCWTFIVHKMFQIKTAEIQIPIEK